MNRTTCFAGCVAALLWMCAGCSDDPPAVTDAAPDITAADVSDATSDVVVTSDLGPDVPSMDLPRIGVCRADSDCLSNELGERACDVATGQCVVCTAANRAACLAGQYCTAGHRCESGCAVDADCARDGGAFRCDVTRHVCVGCTRDDQCPAGQVCGPMTNCVPGCTDRHACLDGQSCCAGQCLRTQTDVANCGACGRACAGAVPNAAPACVAGVCSVAACQGAFADCDRSPTNGCEVDTSREPTHCGACDTACPVRANATATCASGRCGVRCDAGFADCDGDAANGCEVDVRASAANCGSCGNACPAGAHAAATCAGGRCGMACDAGFGDCDTNPANGCEAGLTGDPARCGACGSVCPGGADARPVCASGACRIECLPGFADCDGNASNGCEAALDDPAHCGACGVACAGATPLCAVSSGAAACSSGCAAGAVRCGSTCADTARAVSDCGACDNACPAAANAARTCAAGRCGFACNADFGDCDGVASNGCEAALHDDARHCGACGTVCTAGAHATSSCAGGRCALACEAGFADCDGNASNGCEVDTRASPTSCGACGRSCPVGAHAAATCAAGACGAGCEAGFGDCDTNLTNGCEAALTSSIAHCGACGVACPSRPDATATCAGGVCGAVCNTGRGDCDGNATNGCETDTQSSAAHCGRCGVRCTATQVCAAGRCVEAPSCAGHDERGCGIIPYAGGGFAMGEDTAGTPMTSRPIQPNITVGPFLLDVTEVTMARFRRFWAAGHPAPTSAVAYPGGSVTPGAVTEPTAMGSSVCYWQLAREVPTLAAALDAHPINCVDWPTALAFCVWDGARLPTEAEWEFAARGQYGAPYPAFPWGNDEPMGTVLGVCDRAQWNDCAGEDGVGTRRVASFAATRGLFDLAGNIAEWTADVFAPYDDASCWGGTPRSNPLCAPRSSGAGVSYVTRGSGWNANYVTTAMRGASRIAEPGTTQNLGYGFRCARTAPSP